MSILRRAQGGMLLFFCPGCQCGHGVRVEGPHPVWGWNGSMDAPTFTPSIVASGTELTENGKRDYDTWAEAGYPGERGEFENRSTVCHSFVTDGRIQFLGDCTHALKGQTVVLEDFDS